MYIIVIISIVFATLFFDYFYCCCCYIELVWLLKDSVDHMRRWCSCGEQLVSGAAELVKC